MGNNFLHYQGVSELADRLRKGEFSCTELMEASLSRISALDKNLNAFRMVCAESALTQAASADLALKSGDNLGVLHGIPFAAKDLFDVKGLPTTAGTSLLGNNIAAQDAHTIQVLSRSGMILTGKTNTVQFAFSGVGINHDQGTPYNPWSQDHLLPGGSSSGSGVAVAAGMVPLALGTDTGGSVRVPASLCGTVGLKTTVGRVSRAGVYPLSWSLDSVGVLSRSVEDAALAYQSLQGVDKNDATTWGIALHDVLKDLKEGVRGLRLAFAESVFWEDAHPEVEKGVRACGNVFSELGARVKSVAFAEAKEAQQLNPGGVIIAAEGYTVNRKLLEEDFERLDPVVAQRMIKGKDVTADQYLKTWQAAQRLRAEAANSLMDIDALLVPTTAMPAKSVSEVDSGMDNYLQQNAHYLRNTAIGNILNLCGLSVPCGFTKEGLPIGLLIYGKSFQEDLILRIGHAFEQATDWHKAIPNLKWAETAGE